MSHDDVGLEAVVSQQRHDGGVEGEHGWLADFRLHQVKGGLHDGGLVIRIDEDVVGERLAQNRRHHGVGVGKDLGHGGRQLRQFTPHVDVLAALPGEHEGDFSGGFAAAAEDALRLHRFPRLRIVEAHHLTRFLQPVSQLLMVAVVDDQAFGGLDNGRFRQCCYRWVPTRLHSFERFIEFAL